MKQENVLSDLNAFARKCIAAHRYPNDYHSFTPTKCSTCGIVPLEITIEHHSGSKKGNFRGVIWAQCSDCGGRERIFSFTGKHRERDREERPRCKCGNNRFVVAECERIERDEGVLGFFDEGVVVGKCSECDRNRTLVYTD